MKTAPPRNGRGCFHIYGMKRMYSAQKDNEGAIHIFQDGKLILGFPTHLTPHQVARLAYLMNKALQEGVFIGQMDQSLSREIMDADFDLEFKLNLSILKE